jgi:hypothetical protein
MANIPQANISIKVRSSQGRRKFRTAEVTSDASGTTIPASFLEMEYIDHAILSPQKAALSSVADYNYLTYATATTTLTLASAGSSAAVMDLQAWGW